MPEHGNLRYLLRAYEDSRACRLAALIVQIGGDRIEHSMLIAAWSLAHPRHVGKSGSAGVAGHVSRGVTLLRAAGIIRTGIISEGDDAEPGAHASRIVHAENLTRPCSRVPIGAGRTNAEDSTNRSRDETCRVTVAHAHQLEAGRPRPHRRPVPGRAAHQPGRT